jgi:hypothetical protein
MAQICLYGGFMSECYCGVWPMGKIMIYFSVLGLIGFVVGYRVEEKVFVVLFLFDFKLEWLYVFWCCSLECSNSERFLRVGRPKIEICWYYGPFGFFVNMFVKEFVRFYLHAYGDCMVVVVWLYGLG